MFTIYHFIWLIISLITIITSIILIKKFHLTFNTVLNIACVVCILSEVIKVFSIMKFFELPEGGLIPYIQMQYLPLHLCSIQILFIFAIRILKESKLKSILIACMYPTCILGAFFALLLPSIFTATINVNQAFTHPLAYQFFLYHLMLIILGIYFITNKDIKILNKHYFSTMAILLGLGFFSIYFNAMFSEPVYNETTGILEKVIYTPNFFFTFETPINFKFQEPWQWYVYLSIILCLAFALIAIFYIPIFIRNKKKGSIPNA